jgi:hypothetical protein
MFAVKIGCVPVLNVLVLLTTFTPLSAALDLPAEISYVMEPFEFANATDMGRDIVQLENGNVFAAFNHNSNETVTTSADALFGNHSLKISLNSGADAVSFGNVVSAIEPSHNCLGATHLSGTRF